MENFLLFAIGSIGLTHILTDGMIFQSFRDKIAANYKLQWLSKLIECYQCCGFWCGLFVGLLVFGFNIPTLLACGFASSFLARLGAGYLEYLDSLTNIDLDVLNDK